MERPSTGATGTRAQHAPLFERVTLIGLGLIGSSLAWAMRTGSMARSVRVT